MLRSSVSSFRTRLACTFSIVMLLLRADPGQPASLVAPDSTAPSSSISGEHIPDELTRLLREFDEGTPLKMRSFAGESYAGDLTLRNGGMVLVSFDRFDERRLVPEQVQTLWLQSGDWGIEGMLIGAGVGFVAMGLLGTFVAFGFAETSSRAVLAGLSFGLFLGATPGAILGALFGRGFPKWKLLYEAK